jgi:hypothetical protein
MRKKSARLERRRRWQKKLVLDWKPFANIEWNFHIWCVYAVFKGICSVFLTNGIGMKNKQQNNIIDRLI